METIDEQLSAAHQRRARARDLLVRCLVAIDAEQENIDRLLEDKVAGKVTL